VDEIYQASTAAGFVSRPSAQVREFFDGWDLIDPGLLPAYQWRPTTPGLTGIAANHAGVGRKP
jgi:hypothetical protein